MIFINTIDYEFDTFIKKLKKMDKEDIYINIKRKYLTLSDELKKNIEKFFQDFSFWGKLDYKNNQFEEIVNKTNFLKDNLEELSSLYESLNDYKSKKILLAILKNYYSYDFETLKQVMESCYRHYFDLDLIKTSKESIYVDVGSYIGDSVNDFLDSFKEEYKKIYCYEITPSSLAIMKEIFALNEKIIIRDKALYDKETTLNLTNHVESSANKVKEETGNIQAVTLDNDIKEKIDLIKMDIEGSEEKALLGAKEHIKNDTPTLLISIYHGFSDLIKLPKLIKSFNNHYNYYLRYYGGNIFPTEIVLIAIPKKGAVMK